MVGEISNSEMRGKNVTKGMFDIHYSLEEEGDCREQSRAEEKSCREGSVDQTLQRQKKVRANLFVPPVHVFPYFL